MNDHVLIVSLGPVQGLIAQARRTRDLWFGSFVLSELSKAAAMAIAESGSAALVFPAFSDRVDLEPEYMVRRDDKSKPASVANKIVALVHAGHKPREVAVKARDAARNHLVDWGMKEVFDKRVELVDRDTRAAALEQLETLLEIRASWAEITADCSYKDARQIAERELAARKTLHVFQPWKQERRGCFKSSLDGARPTVLKEKGRHGGEWTEYRIGLREELDAIGLLKRTGGKTDQFIPVPNVGIAAWLDRACKFPKELSQIVEACKPFQRVRASLPWVEAFPYDAQVMLPERWEPYFLDHYVREPRPTPEVVREHVQKARAFGKNAVQPLLDKIGLPYPYVACLVADGDGMGPCIDALAEQGWERHRKLSEALTEFARDSAHRIVERSGHRGVLIYAGGDDVLAFVCVQDALACARELKDSFQETLREVLGRGGPTVPLPTLSVGIGIGHVMQSLGRLLELGRQAEKLAKTPGPAERTLGQSERNALALILEKHSGTTWSVRLPWDGGPSEGRDPLTMMDESISLLESERLATSKIHQVAQMLRRLPRPEHDHDPGVLRVLHEEVRRVLSRAEQGALSPSDVLLALDDRDYARSHRAVERWIQRMLIANELHRARKAAPRSEEAAS
jgi:CRISPR-associated protein Cmr2